MLSCNSLLAMDGGNAIEVRNLQCRYGATVVLDDVSFSVAPGEVFVIAGGSGCGKSTLLKHMIGLYEPTKGEVSFFGRSFTKAAVDQRRRLWREMGVLYQSSALWSAMTVGENVALPLREYTRLPRRRIAELVRLKLAFVGLAGFEGKFPAELSGGMKKRAALARALALDPKILFFDEPSAGLDPLTSRNLDRLILKIRAAFGSTIVVVSHELESIFSIADRVMMLDASERKQIAIGPPKELVEKGEGRVRRFLSRGAALAQ